MSLLLRQMAAVCCMCAAISVMAAPAPASRAKNLPVHHSASGGDLSYLSISPGGATQISYGYHGTANVTLSLTNPSKTLTITGVSLTSADGGFTITSNGCNDAVLTGTARCVVVIDVYAMHTPVEYATFNAQTNEGLATLGLNYSTPAQSLIVTPTSFDFGNQPLLTERSQTIVVSNPNPLPLNLDDPSSSPHDNNNGAGFWGSGTVCSQVSGNGTCEMVIAFAPVQVGPDSASWPIYINVDGADMNAVSLSFTGNGVQSAINVDLSKNYNVVATANDGAAMAVKSGGLDGLGNVYPSLGNDYDDFVQDPINLAWLRQSFNIGPPDAPSAVANQTIVLPAGQYSAVSFLGTAVFGPLTGEPFVLNYGDGSSATVHQSLSDWKKPNFYANESIASASPYRIEADGTTQHPGPYYLYGYTLPTDATKQLMSVTLPPTRNVILVAMNLMPAPLPIAVAIAPYYNVVAIRDDGTKSTTPGIDGLGDAISYEQLSTTPVIASDVPYVAAAPNVPNAVAAATIPLPPGQYSSLRLLGMGVNGERADRTLLIKYSDGTVVPLKQSFSDWHFETETFGNPAISNGIAGESNAIETTYRLNSNGSEHSGFYMLYEYELPLDSSKTVASVQLPSDKDVVVLGMYLEP